MIDSQTLSAINASLSQLPAEFTSGEIAIELHKMGLFVTSSQWPGVANRIGIQASGKSGHVLVWRNPSGIPMNRRNIDLDAKLAALLKLIRHCRQSGTARELFDDMLAQRPECYRLGISPRSIVRYYQELGLVRSGKRGMVAVWTNTNHKPDTI